MWGGGCGEVGVGGGEVGDGGRREGRRGVGRSDLWQDQGNGQKGASILQGREKKKVFDTKRTTQTARTESAASLSVYLSKCLPVHY